MRNTYPHSCTNGQHQAYLKISNHKIRTDSTPQADQEIILKPINNKVLLVILSTNNNNKKFSQHISELQ